MMRRRDFSLSLSLNKKSRRQRKKKKEMEGTRKKKRILPNEQPLYYAAVLRVFPYLASARHASEIHSSLLRVCIRGVEN